MNLVFAIFRTALKLVLIAAAAVFALSLIFVALVSLVWVLLKALLTGRKPAFVTTFQRFNQARQQFKRGGFRAGPSTAGGFSGGFGSRGDGAEVVDVVDVEAHEVSRDQALPFGPSTDRH